jgi:hypothetical protein
MKNPLKEGLLTFNSVGIGTVTRRMVLERAQTLAAIHGRPPHETNKSDWDEAKRQMASDFGTGTTEALIDAVTETETWETDPDSTGHKVPVVAGEDGDSEGRSDRESLMLEGMAGAEMDHSRAASEAMDEDLPYIDRT